MVGTYKEPLIQNDQTETKILHICIPSLYLLLPAICLACPNGTMQLFALNYHNRFETGSQFTIKIISVGISFWR